MELLDLSMDSFEIDYLSRIVTFLCPPQQPNLLSHKTSRTTVF